MTIPLTRVKAVTRRRPRSPHPLRTQRSVEAHHRAILIGDHGADGVGVVRIDRERPACTAAGRLAGGAGVAGNGAAASVRADGVGPSIAMATVIG